jgi:hypothetical protein
MLLVAGCASHRPKPTDDANAPAGQTAAHPGCGLDAPTWEERHPYLSSYAAWAVAGTLAVVGLVAYLIIDNKTPQSKDGY